MTLGRQWGDRSAGAVPPLLLVMVGLLIAGVAGLGLILQLRGPVDGAAAPRLTAHMVTGEVRAPGTLPASVGSSRDGPASARATGAQPGGVEEARENVAPPLVEGPAPAPATSAPAPTSSPASVTVTPSWISIVSGGVDGIMTPRGLSPDGKINPGRQEILWFTGHGRVRPGEVGTAVIAGHVSWEGRPDVFTNLSSVSVGDLVTVGYTDGTSRSFPVVSTAAVGKDELSRSMTVWGAHPDRPRLAIITCDPALGYQPDGHTAANFVVIAEG